MANTINDLYTKYTNKVERTLENDRYFQYLFEIVQAGNNTIRQNNRVLHKVVDERWLTVVEEGLTSIFNIVDSRAVLSQRQKKLFQWHWPGRSQQTACVTLARIRSLLQQMQRATYSQRRF